MKKVDLKKIESDLFAFVRRAYPNMQIRVEAWELDRKKMAIYFIEEKFAVLYPAQRYHYLINLIPDDYYEEYLSDSVWSELAPGEKPEDLRYPDEDLIAEIGPNVMKRMTESGFFVALDDAMCPRDPNAIPAQCHGDYRISRSILAPKLEEEWMFDVFHVFMTKGGFCDCEILYNVARQSRLATKYWRARAEGRKPHDPHSDA